MLAQLRVAKAAGASKIVLSLCDHQHWVGVFIDVKDSDSVALIYNSFDHTHPSSVNAAAIVAQVVSSLG